MKLQDAYLNISTTEIVVTESLHNHGPQPQNLGSLTANKQTNNTVEALNVIRRGKLNLNLLQHITESAFRKEIERNKNTGTKCR